jgi:hypothetical protein
MNGRPYAWEADEMVYWLGEDHVEPGDSGRERERVRFTVVPPVDPTQSNPIPQ